MSKPTPSQVVATTPSPAVLFAALGDETRLALIAQLGAGRPVSIAQLTVGTQLTRQSVTKHLHVLQSAGIVASERDGREQLYRLDPAPVRELRRYLKQVSREWDEALLRLKKLAEK